MKRSTSFIVGLLLLSACSASVDRLPVAASTLPAGTTGMATVRCDVSDEGKPRDCVVVSETPRGQGYGEAAVREAERGGTQPSPAEPQ